MGLIEVVAIHADGFGLNAFFVPASEYLCGPGEFLLL
jgi:hypothetical protein